MNKLHDQMMRDEMAEPVVASTVLCCGAPDAETGQRLHPTEHVAPHQTPRPLRLADVRRVM